MCGRFAFYSPSEAAAALFGVDHAPPVEARYNIAPTQYIAAIRNTDASRELCMLRWGLVPFWAKDSAIGNRMINARAETVAAKPAYRAAYRHRRCLILADGFFEWRKEASGKTPYYMSAASETAMAFAGLWETWDDRETDSALQTATIITTAASVFMQPLHHRMPVLVAPALADAWLQGDTGMLADLTREAPTLRAWPVSSRVNNARNEGEDLLAPNGDVLEEKAS